MKEGAIAEHEKAVHDAIIEEIKKKLRFQYKDIKVNHLGEKSHEFKGFYPDMILSEQGMVLALVEVETEQTYSREKVDSWKKLVGSGPRLILMAPKGMKAKLTAALWDGGIADKVALGSYDITINMP
jgi:hypothetical protein